MCIRDSICPLYRGNLILFIANKHMSFIIDMNLNNLIIHYFNIENMSCTNTGEPLFVARSVCVPDAPVLCTEVVAESKHIC